jgi:hypothetical protein
MSLSLQKSTTSVNVAPLKLLHTSFKNYPDASASIICEFPSGENNTGFQAIVVRSRSDHHAAFGNLGNCTNSDCVFVQTSERGQCFVKFSESKTKVRMSISALLCLMDFFSSADWARVESKMKLQVTTMREKISLVTVEPGLAFVNNGHCQYEAYFENGYAIKARADSKDLSNQIYVWLETPSDKINLDPEPIICLSKSLSSLRNLLKEEPAAKKPRQS